MHRTLKAAVAALACTLIGAPAFAQTIDKIKQTGAITIGHRDASIPFSYYDDQQKVIGYTMDICNRVVDDVKKALAMPNLKVNYQLVTSANRIPLMANGTIDLECGSTTNNIERQKQVSFTNTHFVTANRWVAKKSSNVKTLADLKGKTIVSTAGTTNIKQITEINAAQNLGMNIVSANGHPEAFQMVETGRAVAFVMDDILLYSLAAQSRSPADYEISAGAGRRGVQEDSRRLHRQYLQIRRDQRDLRKMVPEADPAEGLEPQCADVGIVEEGLRRAHRLGRSGRIPVSQP